MESLTSTQIHELAHHFLNMGQAAGQYRIDNFKNLSKTQNKELKDHEKAILGCANDLFALSASIVMNDVSGSLTTLTKITKEIETAYKTLKDVQKAIDIAAAVVTVGAAVMAKNPDAIATSLGGLCTVLTK